MAFSIGFGPLPWAINAELFSAESKGAASSIAFTFNWFCAFLVTKFYPDLEALIDAEGAYFLFSAVCFFGTFFVVFFVPETKGKSQEELRAYFTGKTLDGKRAVSIESINSIDSMHGFENQGYKRGE